jgi:hypothetical protein
MDVTFTKYVRLVLPVDGYVYWVKADLLSASALANAALLNAVTPNQNPTVITPAATSVIDGSFHISGTMLQEESETYTVDRVLFTSPKPIQDFDQIGPSVIFIASFRNVLYAFSSRDYFSPQAGIFHYVGNAVYADMKTQIVDALNGFDASNVVVSNSLPLWLALNDYAPAYALFQNTSLTLYPSFLLPQNLPPPFVAVHVIPESLRVLQAVPAIDQDLNHWQLVSERVRLTLYGTRNFNALDLVDCINQYSYDTDAFGIMTAGVIRDDKRTQPELQTIAMKKSMEYEISYYQQRARNVARQLILQVSESFFIGEEQVA